MLGAVVPIYNVPGVSDIRFSPDVLADIYLDKITDWNDPRIAKDNPGVKSARAKDHRRASFRRQRHNLHLDRLPEQGQPDWKGGPGKGTAINWPTGVGGKGNEGVAAQRARSSRAPSATSSSFTPCRTTSTSAPSRMRAGNWVKGSIEGVTAAAATAKIPADYRVSITNAPGPNAYPISSFTYLLIPTQPSRHGQGKSHQGHAELDRQFGRERSFQSLLRAAPAAWQQKVLKTIYALP